MAYTSKKLEMVDCLMVTNVALDQIHSAAQKVLKHNFDQLDQRAQEEIGDLLSTLPVKWHRNRLGR
jgi:hypothetical protein